ncbi:chemotaxis protein CheD [bacterium]|nr:chemotaxis protein CheD [bacterium]
MEQAVWRMDSGYDQRVVDIAEYTVSDDPNALLVTYSLGSCLGLAVHDPVAMLGGLIHCLLPRSSLKPEDAGVCPAKFVDIGVPALLEEMFSRGARKENLVLKVAGCGQVFDFDTVFHVGRINYQVLRKFLKKNGLRLAAEHIGGMLARTMRLYVGSGKVTVHAAGQLITL